MQSKRKLALLLLAAAAGMCVVAVRATHSSVSKLAVAPPARKTLTDVGLASEERALLVRAGAAAASKPLLAALEASVDSTTMLDLLSLEPWWQNVREEFQVSRVVFGIEVLATHGKPELRDLDREVVERARRDGLASSLVELDGRSFALIATKLSARPDQAPVLVLAKRVELPPQVPAATAAPPAPPTRAPWELGGSALLALIGVGLWLSSSRRARVPSDAATPDLLRSNEEEYDLTMSGHLHPRAPQPPELASPDVPHAHLRHPTAPDGMPVAGDGSAGQRFGRYQLLNRIGEGGMSEVFTAMANGVAGFRRVFVLKRLRRELSRDAGAVAQFIDEARTQASLIHSNVVPVFDFGCVGDEYFMTQEYIVGRDLGRVMREQYDRVQDTVSARFAQYVAHETLMALEYAHTRRDIDGEPLGIVHRDISPGNVIVSAQGEVKLADFGIVKWNRRVSQTQSGMVKGNANFIAPEQARGLSVDPRSDLFSLGLVLYYMLTNRPPYDGVNDLEVVYKAASGPSLEMQEHIETLSSPAREALTRVLALEPAERFQSAAEFARALAPNLEGAKTEAARLMKQLFGAALLLEAA